jgi:hypothetical protein
VKLIDFVFEKRQALKVLMRVCGENYVNLKILYEKHCFGLTGLEKIKQIKLKAKVREF